jgi:hypothetical protein
MSSRGNQNIANYDWNHTRDEVCGRYCKEWESGIRLDVAI